MVRLHRRVLLAAIALVVLTQPAFAGASACPSERTCAAYAQLNDARFAISPDGAVRIPYFVNRLGAATLTEAEVVGAVKAATLVWERANPRIRFVYRGMSRTFAGVDDGVNVIGFGIPARPDALAEAAVTTREGRVVDADIIFNATVPWSWQPCAQRDGACGPAADDIVPRNPLVRSEVADFQGVATRELGHWLSLGHPDQKPGTRQTMSITAPAGRGPQTLALGDIVGVRAMYPCGRCSGAPVVFVP